MNPYQLLGVASTASDAEIKSSYRKLARIYHPDAGASADEDKMAEINEAFQILSSPDARAQLDASLGFKKQTTPPSEPPPAPEQPTAEMPVTSVRQQNYLPISFTSPLPDFNNLVAPSYQHPRTNTNYPEGVNRLWNFGLVTLVLISILLVLTATKLIQVPTFITIILLAIFGLAAILLSAGAIAKLWHKSSPARQAKHDFKVALRRFQNLEKNVEKYAPAATNWQQFISEVVEKDLFLFQVQRSSRVGGNLKSFELLSPAGTTTFLTLLGEAKRKHWIAVQVQLPEGSKVSNLELSSGQQGTIVSSAHPSWLRDFQRFL